MIQADVYEVLSEDSSIADIVSTRIYPIELPQGVKVPAIVYNVRITPVRSLNGESGLDNVSIEITCWAKDYTTAHLLASAVRAAFVAAGIAVLTGDMEDTRDEETRSCGVVMNMVAWSSAAVGATPQNLKNPIVSWKQKGFIGDGTTTEFILPSKFRSEELIVFFNGRVAKKGLESDLTAAYWEKSTRDGFVFRVAPKGGNYPDELLAVYPED